ncbi:nitronate monooxygenase [Sulfurimonas sp. MAG313]|nr:nitronate monooxygenase [Sulfurimonas sp. MAG313]MDF1879977.1 nitronate monooxygenase [Sulfurimonas sp. MAG313]
MSKFLEDTGITVPIIGGPMYPCSNPELVAAVSEAGGIGIVQPISLTYVHGYEFKEGLEYIKSLTSKPIGMNVLIEKSSAKYEERMKEWISIALEEGIKFFITSLGKPDWVVTLAHAKGAKVYHDVTELKWAKIAVESKVDGLICVNANAGGHAGDIQALALYNDLKDLGLPLVCAGGVGDKQQYEKMLSLGYLGVQMGTRFIVSDECKVPQNYKEAIIKAKKEDIVYSLNLTGVKVSVINTPYIQGLGLKPNVLVSYMLRYSFLKRFIHLFYMLRSIKNLKGLIKGKKSQQGFFQAGKSVEGIDATDTVKNIIKSFL